MQVVLTLLQDWVNAVLLLGLVIASLLLLSHPGSSGHLRETRVPVAAAEGWHLGSTVIHAPVGRSSASEEGTSECFHTFGLLFYDNNESGAAAYKCFIRSKFNGYTGILTTRLIFSKSLI